MPRKRTSPEEIRNPERYYKHYLAKEILHTRIEQTEYEKRFVSLDAMMTKGDEEHGDNASKYIREACTADSLEDKYIEHSFFAWIDEIENPDLYEAIQNLTEDQKIYLTLRFHLCFTQSEIAEFFHIRQQNASKRERRIMNRIKDFLKKGV